MRIIQYTFLAYNMKAIEILYNLEPYQRAVQELYKQAREKTSDLQLKTYLHMAYKFITIELKSAIKEAPDNFNHTLIQVKFEIRQDKMLFTEIYCLNNEDTDKLEKWIKNNTEIHDAHWHTERNNTWYHNPETTAYLNIADEIAEKAYLCNSGDDYQPGYYSEITVEEDLITLDQLNLHNSRSSDHKSDYMMRKLKFEIPMTNHAVLSKFNDYEIGNMGISFSDSSSENNKGCGKAILAEIIKQKAVFDDEKK